MADDGVTPLGLDLGRHFLDVRRVTLAKFHPEGIDREDLVAAVLAAIARRNRLPCAYDPRRAGVTKYIWTVARSVTSNLQAAQRRWESVVAPTDDPESAPELVDDDDSIARFEHVDHAMAFGGEEHEALWERALRVRAEERAEALRPKQLDLFAWLGDEEPEEAPSSRVRPTVPPPARAVA
jgi:hypothetical protein